MIVIGVLAQKGGVGKTTLTLNLACEASRRGLKVVAIDIDPQGSLSEWALMREQEMGISDRPLVIHRRPADIPELLEYCKEENVDLVLIDTLPRIEKEAVDVGRLSDLVALVAGPTLFDLKALDKTTELVSATQTPGCFVVNRGRPGAGAHGAAINLEAIRLLEGVGWPVHKKPIMYRAAFQDSTAEGKCVQEYGDSKGRREIALTLTWLLSLHQKEN